MDHAHGCTAMDQFVSSERRNCKQVAAGRHRNFNYQSISETTTTSRTREQHQEVTAASIRMIKSNNKSTRQVGGRGVVGSSSRAPQVSQANNKSRRLKPNDQHHHHHYQRGRSVKVAAAAAAAWSSHNCPVRPRRCAAHIHRPTTTTTATVAILQLSLLLLACLSLCGPALNAQRTAQASGNGGDQSQQPPEQPTQSFVFRHNPDERDANYWLASGKSALESALRWAPNYERAKSAVIFIGDGMSLSTITAARILQGQLSNRSGEEDQLSFEQLNNVALIKTYNIDQQVPDSAATATAILSGVKTNFYTLGVNGNVKHNDTNCAHIQANHVNSILKMAQDAGKSTGIVTNTRITHATPAAAYAHVSNRRWECDTLMPRTLTASDESGSGGGDCKDIARQLIEDEPGSKLNVVLGGGRRYFFGPNFLDPGPTGQPGMRADGRNLIDSWITRRRASNANNYAFVNSTRDLRLISENTDYLLGLFSYSHMSYEELRDTSPSGEPSLTEMTEVALKILSKNPLGFVLLVEGGRIDHAHHENVAGVALRETISLSWAVQRARQLVNARDTLLAVTSDHAHALSINGIAPRGNPILGLTRYRENNTALPYTTLLYGSGPGNRGGQRPDPRVGPNSTESPYHVQYAAIHQGEAIHDGSDVAIFASGPHAHLFQGSQEQSYIAHVFSYAMCIGNYLGAGTHCHGAGNPELNGNELGGGGVGGGPNRIDQTFDASTTRHELANPPPMTPPIGRGGPSSSYNMRAFDDYYKRPSAAAASSSSAVTVAPVLWLAMPLALAMAAAITMLARR